MKITNKLLKQLGMLIVLAGVLVTAFTEGKSEYIGIGVIILGMIVMMPWVNEKKENS